MGCVHADGHVVVAIRRGDVHRERRLAGFEVEGDELPHAGGQVLHVTVDVAGGGGELHHRGITDVVAAPDAFHDVAVVGLDGVDTLDTRDNHAVALEQPVCVVDVLVALDGRVAVGLCQVGAAGTEPVAGDDARAALPVVVHHGGVLNRNGHISGQFVDDGAAGDDLARLHAEREQTHGLQVVGEEDEFAAKRRRATATPCQAAARRGCAFAAVLCAGALIGSAPHDLDPVVSAQHVAGKVCMDDGAVRARGNAVLGPLARFGQVHVYLLGQVDFVTCKNGVDCRGRNVAHGTLLPAVGIDAEAARHKPQVTLVVEHDGKQVLIDGDPEGGLGCCLHVDVEDFLEHGQRSARLIGGTQHEHVVVVCGAHDEVARVNKGVRTLDDVAAAIVLRGRETAQCSDLFGVMVADGEAAQEGRHGVVEIVEENRRRGVGVGGLKRDVDLREDAHGQHCIGRVGVAAVVVDVGLARSHERVRYHGLGIERFRWHGRLI